MSDLTGGYAGGGYGRVANNGGTIAQSGPVPVGSPAGNIRGPTQIMRERKAREAKKQAEEEAKKAFEQERAEDEQRLVDLENQRSAERRNISAEQSHRSDIRGANVNTGKNSAYSAMPSSQTQARVLGRTATGEPMENPRQSREAAAGQSRQTRNQVTSRVSASSGPAPQSASAIPQTDTASSSRRVTRSSFPHAFERWETLSAHWEGLTSYWVRRLEENSSEISREPLSQQMSRQITDLSAAGANLFHAVVELQRLRASSERKFQRWFFETRQQEEKAQELLATQEKSLQDERNSRSKAIEDAVRVAVAAEKENSNSQELIKEMKRELTIAREEARRAWEELGRREQEERERTLSLRDGHPTLVGGVQVVPMMQGVTSRHSSARDARPPTRDGPSNSERPIGGVGGSQPQFNRGQPESTVEPLVESSRPAKSSTRPGNANPVQYPNIAASEAAFYRQNQTDPTGRDQHNTSYGPSEPYSEEEYVIDAQGQYRRDSQGNKIRYRAGSVPDSIEEYDAPETAEHGQTHGTQYSHPPPVAQFQTTSSSRMESPEDEYSGEGYGGDWEAVRTHHHPTRLSDVLEEDERSRTSASQLSRG